MTLSKLSAKQTLFVQEYAADFNATKAAERAGHSRRTARQIGAENLTKPDIRKAIESYLECRSTAVGNTIEDWTSDLIQYVTADIADIFDEHGVPKTIAECVSACKFDP